jgi:hypothetical protein
LATAASYRVGSPEHLVRICRAISKQVEHNHSVIVELFGKPDSAPYCRVIHVLVRRARVQADEDKPAIAEERPATPEGVSIDPIG